MMKLPIKRRRTNDVDNEGEKLHNEHFVANAPLRLNGFSPSLDASFGGHISQVLA